MKKLLLACAFAALVTPLASAADSPWAGNWKLDPAKSHFTGETFTYSKAANGMMHYADGSTVAYDFGIDGKEYPTTDGRTTTWIAAGNNAWDSVGKYNGNVFAKTHRTLSADGKTLTWKATQFRPDGTSATGESVWTRVNGTTGLEGKWKSTAVKLTAPDTYTVTAKDGGVLHWEIPAFKESVEGKLDGSDLAITGPIVPPGVTISYKTTSPKVLSYVVKENGKPVSIGRQTLSADGKSFTDVSWDPGKESEKTSGYYVKQ